MKQESVFLSSQFRARDVLKGISFLSFYKLCIHMQGVRATFKRNGSLGYYITWSEMEKQNIKAKLGLFGWFLPFYHPVVG